MGFNKLKRIKPLKGFVVMTNETIQKKLTEKFGDSLTDWQEPYGMLTFSAPKDFNLKVLQYLYDDEFLNFRFLTDLQAVHYPDRTGEELAVVYHLHNFTDNVRIRFKVFLDIQMTRLHASTTISASVSSDHFEINLPASCFIDSRSD